MPVLAAHCDDHRIDWIPFPSAEIRWDHSCGIGPDGHWHGWFHVRVHPTALRRIVLHPDQPTAEVTGPSPPGWWQAAAERAHQRPRHRT
ncbi:hypothetical protein ACQB60_20345 [Actinomycetota bacterium Odt1-20B]